MSMPEFKVKVELICKTCNQKFCSTIPDEMYVQPHPSARPVTITIEELRNNVEKNVLDISGNIIGTLEMGGFEFTIPHPRCNSKNKYTVNDCTFLPS